jgi:hypothetical protein
MILFFGKIMPLLLTIMINNNGYCMMFSGIDGCCLTGTSTDKHRCTVRKQDATAGHFQWSTFANYPIVEYPALTHLHH